MDISLRYSCLLLFLAVLPAAQAMDGAPFVAPYNSYDAAYDFFGNISQNVSIATYTFSSPEIADMVLGIRQKGIRIRLLVDADPVGGIKDFLPMLCTLRATASMCVFIPGSCATCMPSMPWQAIR